MVLHGLKKDLSCTCKDGPACRSSGKHPTKKAWLTAEAPDVWPSGRNIGIATGGASGFVVLDVDGPEGQASLDALETEHGPLPSGPMQITGSGGRHYLFRCPDMSLGNRVRVRPGLDVRADGAQIVVAPSQHKSGARYRWQDFDKDLPDLPDWLLDLMAGDSARGVDSDFDFATWLAKQDPCIEGENGSAKLMAVARKAVHSQAVLTLDDWLTAVEEFNERCEPPWSEGELVRAYENAHARWLADGKVKLRYNNRGQPENSLMSVRAIVAEDPLFKGRVRRNHMGDYDEYDGQRLDDDMVLVIRGRICERYGFRELGAQRVQECLQEQAALHPYSPVVDYLDALEWDGVQRLDKIPGEVLGAAGTLAPIMVRKWLISAVARAYRPGCDVQTALILHGVQGVGKSPFFRIMGEPWFSDTAIDITNKDAYQQLALVWIYEWGELDALYRAKEMNSVKAFMSAAHDTYRKSHARLTKRVARRCVFCGTTNRHDFLYDRTGSRRFWVVSVDGVLDNGKRDIEGRVQLEVDRGKLAEWRDQIWAEAVAAYQNGETWYLPPALEAARAEDSEQYTQETPMYEAAKKVLASGKVKTIGDYVTLEALAEALGMDVTRQGPVVTGHLTQALVDSGYKGARRWVVDHAGNKARLRVYVNGS